MRDPEDRLAAWICIGMIAALCGAAYVLPDRPAFGPASEVVMYGLILLPFVLPLTARPLRAGSFA
jgi:hypothetical protein